MALTETAEFNLAVGTPDRMIMVVDGLPLEECVAAAFDAVAIARRNAPKMSGAGASRLTPIWGEGWFGVYFPDPYMWYQEKGIQPFTMNSLQGKTIPMWVDDPTGTERLRNPKAKIRTTESGKTQVLIFRKASMKGARVTKRRYDRKTKTYVETDAPASYPGAPGRIGKRQAGAPLTTPGKVAGAIASGNVGVRWRHPGLAPRMFINNAITLAAELHGVLPVRVYVADGSWKGELA